MQSGLGFTWFVGLSTTCVLFGALAASASGCSSDDEAKSSSATSSGSGGSGGAGALTPDGFCEAFSATVCDAAAKCDCAAMPNAPSCLQKNVDNCKASLVGYIGAVSLGDLSFRPESAQACVDGAREVLKTCALPTSRNQPSGCAALFLDKAAVGASCSKLSLGLLCAEGEGACDDMTGQCLALGKEGEPCIGVRCADGYVCDQPICRKLQAEGGPCNTDLGCESGFLCESMTCAPRRMKGAACGSSSECAVGLACLSGVCDTAVALGEGCTNDACGSDAICVDTSGLKTCSVKAKAGEPCPMFDDCEAGTVCDYSTSTPVCTPLPKLGAACPMGTCAGDAVCANGSCVVVPKLGEACALGASKPCEDGLGCDVGTMSCVEGGKAGEACAGTNQACAVGVTCDASENPAMCKAPAGEGTKCNGLDSLCSAGLYCDGVKNACSTQAAVGGACSSVSACVTGAYCEFGPNGGVCKTLPAMLGDACSSQCGGDLRCFGSTGICEKGACALR